MLNAAAVPDERLQVIDYGDPAVAERMANGTMNTDEATVLANISSSIRRSHTQMRPGPIRSERVCLVGSGPSLASTEAELRDLVWRGAHLVTMNAGYHWCIEHGLKPNTQIVMDARPTNARFLEPAVPDCRYVLASQCAPEVWQAVEGRPNVWIFHAVVKQEGATSDLLDKFYLGQWLGIGGGTTVATRAIHLLRLAGYVRFSLFGIDCCVLDGEHHALPQPENARDAFVRVKLTPSTAMDEAREFVCAPWGLKQYEDFLAIMKINGQHFTLDVHGDGMLAYTLRTLGSEDPTHHMQIEQET